MYNCLSSLPVQPPLTYNLFVYTVCYKREEFKIKVSLTTLTLRNATLEARAVKINLTRRRERGVS
jgi:hypothetical protein